MRRCSWAWLTWCRWWLRVVKVGVWGRVVGVGVGGWALSATSCGSSQLRSLLTLIGGREGRRRRRGRRLMASPEGERYFSRAEAGGGWVGPKYNQLGPPNPGPLSYARVNLYVPTGLWPPRPVYRSKRLSSRWMDGSFEASRGRGGSRTPVGMCSGQRMRYPGRVSYVSPVCGEPEGRAVPLPGGGRGWAGGP